MDAHSQSTRPLALPPGVDVREFFDSLTQGIMIFNRDGVILDVNDAAADIIDMERQALVGRTVADLPVAVDANGEFLADEDRPASVVLRTAQSITMRTIGLDLPLHGRRWIMLHNRLLVVNGEVVGVSSSFIDITALRHATTTSDLFAELNHSVMHSRDEDEFLASVCSALVTTGGYALAALGVATTDERRSIQLLHAAGATGYLDTLESTGTWSESSDTGLGALGTALRTGRPQVSHDLPHHPLWRERAVSAGLRSMMALPFTIGERSAVLALYAREQFAFGDDVVERLTQMIEEVGFGVDHLAQTRKLSVSLEGTLRALAHLTEIHDPFTANHQYRVAQLSEAIARRLDLDEATVRLIYQSGLVLDIGKSSIPAEILTRPRPLTPLEFSMVQHHCEIGAAILERANLPQPLAEVARQHHERLDGSGYPEGLMDGAISVPARVAMVADVLEAMTQHRPYRPAHTLERAFTYVHDNAGTRFDLDVVRAVEAVFAEGFTFNASSWSASPLGVPLGSRAN